MVGTCHDDATNASVIGRPEDVIRHLDVVLLVEKVVQGIRATAAFIAKMYHGVHALKVPGVLASVGGNEVEHHNVLDLLTLAILLRDIDQDEIVSGPEGRQELA